MDKTYIVKITSQAEEQIQEIIHYITYELKAPDAALHLLDALEDRWGKYECPCNRYNLRKTQSTTSIITDEYGIACSNIIPKEFTTEVY